ncbi:lantibiotic dehydratase [Paenibacillus sp. MMS20-IR301]|uniref:lantibiotic dehydratase n=1 Tax=Paenibacillus sp. MMS20-IR301 TaxID=2895946 RepID=UPI0028ECB147|nr:lantibiotic dehydratase [Paenibacillus sp. MMS20-IR301]WNS41173.1 lantibiotic dehydratase [Paenibacillus sp. MMS20-IR301]
MSQKSYHYETLDFFMLRAPLLSIDRFKEYFPRECEDQEKLRETSLAYLISLSKSPVIREAIAASSPSLLDSLAHLDNSSNPRKQRQVIKGFMRYLLRMLSRPTPFGLFSGVTYGMFDQRSAMTMNDTPAYRKRARPDMEWFLKIIENIESQEEIVSQLQVQQNSLIYRQGERAKIPYTAKYGTLDLGENNSVSVRATMAFETVMRACERPVQYSKLVQTVHKEFPEAGIDTISQYIWQLFNQEFLISALRPPTTNAKPLEYLITALQEVSGVEKLTADLLYIREQIRDYEETPVGSGEAKLLNLYEEMKAIVDVPSLLQIDMSFGDQAIRINHTVRKDIELAAELLMSFSAEPQESPHLREYCDDFLEKYGPHREIPLLELLDEELGLGAPATYRYPQSRRNIKSPAAPLTSRREQCMVKWLLSSLHKEEQEIVLDEVMIQELIGSESKDTRPFLPSMELFFSILAEDEKAVDNGDYTLVLGPYAGSHGAGMTFGRFIDILGDPFKDLFKVINQKEEQIVPDKLITEISYLPSAGRVTNVVLTENFRNYEMAMGTNQIIPEEKQVKPNDLVVGVRDGYFYVKSLKYNQEIMATANHMLNINESPNVYRFLREVNQQGYRRWRRLDWGILDVSPFTPRIRYKNIILSHATWNLRLPQEIIDLGNKADCKPLVEDFLAEWKVPRYAYMIHFDNRIMLDLHNPLHIEEVCKDLITNHEVTFIEHFGEFNGHPVHREDGRLIAEFVFPLVKRYSDHDANKESALMTTGSRENVLLPITEKSQRIFLPGDTWFYAKLYGIDSRQDEFLARHWQAFSQGCNEIGAVEHAYFIRYSDPEQHIRARFFTGSTEKTGKFMPLFYEWTAALLQDGMISKVVVDTYEPELERYGGPQLMPLAEVVFSADSEVSAELIRLMRFNQIELSQEVVAVISVVEILRQFGYSHAEILALFNRHFDVKEYLNEFRQARTLLMQLLGADSSVSLPDCPDGATVYNILELRTAALRDYAAEFMKQETGGTLFNSKEDVLLSIIHMHLNRLLGIDRNQERKIMIMTRHAVNSLVQYRRKKG